MNENSLINRSKYKKKERVRERETYIFESVSCNKYYSTIRTEVIECTGRLNIKFVKQIIYVTYINM